MTNLDTKIYVNSMSILRGGDGSYTIDFAVTGQDFIISVRDILIQKQDFYRISLAITQANTITKMASDKPEAKK